MNEINTPLLRKVLDHITAHPEEWNQREWATRTDCGTAYCVAGHAVLMAGEDIDWTSTWGFGDAQVASLLESGRTISQHAQDVLGLNAHQAEELFWQTNTLRRIVTLANQFTDGEIPIPDELPDGS